LLATLRTGTVTVARLNRQERNSAYIMQVVADLHERQVRFVALDLGIDTATPARRLVLGLFAALAEYDRESIRERAADLLPWLMRRARGRRLVDRTVAAGRANLRQRRPTGNPEAHLPAAAFAGTFDRPVLTLASRRGPGAGAPASPRPPGPPTKRGRRGRCSFSPAS
jgi:Resolvase, N terminal domain